MKLKRNTLDGLVIVTSFFSLTFLLPIASSEMWQTEAKPRFDAGVVCPALVEIDREGIIPNGRALVPGCGRGYDVTYLANENRVVYGIDIVQIAIDAATARLESIPDEEGVNKANSRFQLASFFELPTDQDSQFDFIYDYTFFCALDPSLREAWADKMSQLVKSNGILCTIIFPICQKVGGPPFAVSLSVYRDLLEARGFTSMRLADLSPESSHPNRGGQVNPDGTVCPTSGIGLWRRE
jgi:methyl halide transferase